MESNKYQEAIVVIARQQEKIIGKNLSDQVVKAVPSLKLDTQGNPILIESADPKEVLGELVDEYATVFGQASIEFAKEAVQGLRDKFSINELPENLQ